jgi:uncharacterized membrane protein (UPF0127 family)
MHKLLLPILLCLSSPGWAGQDSVTDAVDTAPIIGEIVSIETSEGRQDFRVDLALSPTQQLEGLSSRTTLDADSGMLFVYEPARRSSGNFQDHQIALDILYLDADGKILKVIAFAQPGSQRLISSSFVVAAELQIAAGRVAALQIRPGQHVEHRIFGTPTAPESDEISPPTAEEAAPDVNQPTE